MTEEKTAEEMAEAIQKLYLLWEEDKAVYQNMQKNCLDTAVRFGSNNVNKKMQEIYKNECAKAQEEM